MTNSVAAPPVNAIATFHVDARGAHTVIKIYAPGPPVNPFLAHVELTQMRPADGAAWLAERGWSVFDEQVATAGTDSWVLNVWRADHVVAADAADTKALEQVRADIAHDPWDGQYLLEYLAHHDQGIGGELARKLFELRGADDGAYEEAYGDGFDRPEN